MGFAWNNFGILTHSDEDEKYFYIHNDKGDWRKISKEKYAPNLPNLKAKVQTLMGKPIIFRTSQNTANWSPSEWFSDIDVDESGFHNPEAIVPFSEPKFTEGVEPEPESNEALKKKIEELKKKHSDEREEWNAERSELINKNSELELAYSKLQRQIKEEADALPAEKRNKNDLDAKRLAEMKDLIGSSYDLLVRGHPARQLLMRVGKIIPKGKQNVEVVFIKLVKGNTYQVRLPEFDNVEAIASVGFNEDKRMYVANFRNMDPNYFQNFEKIMGEPDENFKDRNMTPEERLEIYHKVMGE